MAAGNIEISQLVTKIYIKLLLKNTLHQTILFVKSQYFISKEISKIRWPWTDTSMSSCSTPNNKINKYISLNSNVCKKKNEKNHIIPVLSNSLCKSMKWHFYFQSVLMFILSLKTPFVTCFFQPIMWRLIK